LPLIREQLPASIELDILRDSSVSIRESSTTSSSPSALHRAGRPGHLPVPAHAARDHDPQRRHPDGTARTFVAMHFCGFTLDNLSLLALTSPSASSSTTPS
jgi:HAE1 family hydrophobic/amphiphilic exporter-1